MRMNGRRSFRASGAGRIWSMPTARWINRSWNPCGGYSSSSTTKGLVYEDYRSMHICPRCETTLSQQEVSEGYKDVKDIAVTVKFKLKHPEKIGLTGNVYMLAWTTTPWTLPGNVALAVGKDHRILCRATRIGACHRCAE
jgi:hypothetical protein